MTLEFAEHSPYKLQIDQVVTSMIDNNYTGLVGVYPPLMPLLPALYVKLFHQTPFHIDFDYYDEYCDGELEKLHTESRFSEDTSALENYEKEHTTFKGSIEVQQTLAKIIADYDKDDIAVIRADEYPIVIINSLKIIVFFKDHAVCAFAADSKLPQFIIDSVVTVDEDDPERVRYFSYVICGNHGFDTTDLPVKKFECPVEDNYNDDIPDEKIVDFIKNGKSGICILNGAPGTGKTHYIRHLMWECKDTDFMVLNSSCFDAINDSSFVEMMLDNRNSVVILEDCEDLLTDRLGNNSRIGTLLNISEGILGDSLRLRFICTFNAPVSKIDAAVIRKGRTHVKYEFKPLTYDKALKLSEKLGVELPEKSQAKKVGYTLAEIYNAASDVTNETSTSVGFKK